MNSHRLFGATEVGCGSKELPVAANNIILRRVLRTHLRQCRLLGKADSTRKIDRRQRQRVIEAVDRSICGLPTECRAVVVMCVLEGQPVARIAERLDWAVPQVRVALRRGLTLLCRRLARRGLRISPRCVLRLMRRDAQLARLPVPEICKESSARVAGLAEDFLKTSR